MKYKCEVDEDDEKVGITGGSIVNLIVTFSRPSMADPKNDFSGEKDEKNKEGENVALVKKDTSTPKSETNADALQPPKTKDEDLVEVHAPFFPEKKNELWWLIITDERRVVGITRIASLKHGTIAKVPFQAPAKQGIYTYAIKLLSDSYVGFDIAKTFKMKVEKELPFKEPEYPYKRFIKRLRLRYPEEEEEEEEQQPDQEEDDVESEEEN
jgi:hypothetical protein